MMVLIDINIIYEELFCMACIFGYYDCGNLLINLYHLVCENEHLEIQNYNIKWNNINAKD
jgi:hypothetical protein